MTLFIPSELRQKVQHYFHVGGIGELRAAVSRPPQQRVGHLVRADERLERIVEELALLWRHVATISRLSCRGGRMGREFDDPLHNEWSMSCRQSEGNSRETQRRFTT